MKQNNIFYLLAYKAARALCSKSGSRLFDIRQVRSDLKLLEPSGKEEERLQDYVTQKTMTAMLVLAAGGMLALLLLLQGWLTPVVKDGRITRNSYGQGERLVEVTVSDGQKKRDMEINVKEQKYSGEETIQLFERLKTLLDEAVLGENPSADEVRKPLNLMTSLRQYPVSISWELDNYRLMDTAGNLLTEEIPEEGELVQLTAHLEYEGQTADYTFAVRLLPPVLSEKDRFFKRVEQTIEQEDEAAREQAYLPLPNAMDGISLFWRQKADKRPLYLLLLAAAASICVFLGKDYELHQRTEERQRQMQLDYPEIISKLSLLLGAGMTVRGAWDKVCSDYAGKKRPGRPNRFAYEEMLITSRQMANGIPELRAYELFGKRCGQQQYMKLGSLLSQNVKKGSSGLTRILEEESAISFEERKRLAKKQGEEAGTKLLLPMFMMLGVVMVIIVFPAFMSLG